MLSFSDFKDNHSASIAQDFVHFVAHELHLDHVPTIQLLSKPIHEKVANSFAEYRPETKSIEIGRAHV